MKRHYHIQLNHEPRDPFAIFVDNCWITLAIRIFDIIKCIINEHILILSLKFGGYVMFYTIYNSNINNNYFPSIFSYNPLKITYLWVWFFFLSLRFQYLLNIFHFIGIPFKLAFFKLWWCCSSNYPIDITF